MNEFCPKDIEDAHLVLPFFKFSFVVFFIFFFFHSCGDIDRAHMQIVKTDTTVNALKLDDVFELVKEPIGDNCDYLLEDDKKSALIELTCSNEDYVKSKRTKAKEQLLSTLEMLYMNSIIRIHFERKSEKYVVFSWRDTTKRDMKDDLASFNMLEMTKMSDATYSLDNESRFEFDFKYKEIRYPDKLVWGK